MRDAACQPAEALELLRAEQLRLEPLALRHVAEEGDVEPGEEVGAGGGLGDATVPSLRCDSHSASIGPAGDELGPVRSTVASLFGGQELVDLPADQVALGDAEVISQPAGLTSM